MSGTDVLGDLKGVIEKLQDYAGRDQSLREAYLEVGTAVADVLALLEKQGPDMARAIADALKNIKLDMKAPEIRIDVSPTPVEVRVAAPIVNVAAPVVNMPQAQAVKRGGWDFDVDPKPGGGFTMRAKPTA